MFGIETISAFLCLFGKGLSSHFNLIDEITGAVWLTWGQREKGEGREDSEMNADTCQGSLQACVQEDTSDVE